MIGAASDGEAAPGRAEVADSLLVKCSLYGEDPYWGRVVSELGSAGVAFDPDRVDVAYGGVAVCRDGIAGEHDTTRSPRTWPAARRDRLRSRARRRGGDVLTTDLGHGYIDENRRTS